jgi:hypothetical protein
MGATCSKMTQSSATAEQVSTRATNESGTLLAMFRRIDKEGKGYIHVKNLDDLMKNDKTFFAEKGPTYILDKYGTDGKMTMDQFTMWWSSTYTTYNDDTVAEIVHGAQMETNANPIVPRRPQDFNVSITRS